MKKFLAIIVIVWTSLGNSNEARAQNLSPWPYSESCNSGISECFAITQFGGSVAIGGFGINGSSGVFGETDVGYGVGGQADGANGWGVYGEARGSGGTGVYGIGGSSGIGVHGTSTGNHGLEGATSGYPYAGVYGTNSNASGGWGVRGDAVGSGSAVYGHNTNTSGWGGYFDTNVNIVGSLYFNGVCYHGPCTSSDARLKKNVQPLSGSLDAIVKLRPVSYEWKEPSDRRPAGTHIGFIAQEVERVKPEWVGMDEQGFRYLKTDDLPVLLVDSVRALKMENDELRERVKLLEAGRRPMISGFGEGGVGVGLLGIAIALAARRRK